MKGKEGQRMRELLKTKKDIAIIVVVFLGIALISNIKYKKIFSQNYR